MMMMLMLLLMLCRPSILPLPLPLPLHIWPSCHPTAIQGAPKKLAAAATSFYLSTRLPSRPGCYSVYQTCRIDHDPIIRSIQPQAQPGTDATVTSSHPSTKDSLLLRYSPAEAAGPEKLSLSLSLSLDIGPQTES